MFKRQKAVDENYPDFEDVKCDVANAEGQGPWTNAELLDEVCLSDDASEGLKYLGKRTQVILKKLFHGKLKLDKDPFIIRNFAKLLEHFSPPMISKYCWKNSLGIELLFK